MLLQNCCNESHLPLKISGGVGSSKGAGTQIYSRPLHSDALERLFLEDNLIPAASETAPYVLGVEGYDPAPPTPGTTTAAPVMKSSRVREIRRHEFMKLPSNPEGVTLMEPKWKS